MKINNLSSSVDNNHLPNNLNDLLGYNKIINIQNHNIGTSDLYNNNSSKKKNDKYKISNNSNSNPSFLKNKDKGDFMLPSIKNNRGREPNLKEIEDKKSLDLIIKKGKKSKGDKENFINFLNNNDNLIKKDGIKFVKNKSSFSGEIKSSDDKYIIEMQNKKIKDLVQIIKHLTQKEEELKKRNIEIEEREKIFNFKEDKENMINKQFKEYENLQKEIATLDIKNKKLEKEIKEKEEIMIKIEKYLKNNNNKIEMIKENKKLIQENSMLKGKIKELEEENEKLKNGQKKIIKLKIKSKDKEP